jgi:hypothetical protein
VDAQNCAEWSGYEKLGVLTGATHASKKYREAFESKLPPNSGGEFPFGGFATSEVTSSFAFQAKATNLSKGEDLSVLSAQAKAL